MGSKKASAFAFTKTPFLEKGIVLMKGDAFLYARTKEISTNEKNSQYQVYFDVGNSYKSISPLNCEILSIQRRKYNEKRVVLYYYLDTSKRYVLV